MGIVFDLIRSDSDALKYFEALGTDTTNTYISFPPVSISDTADNAIISQPQDDSFPASEVYKDQVAPELQSASLDLDAGTLTLSFSETVRAASMNVSRLTLQASQNNNPIGDEFSFTLTGGDVNLHNDPALQITLTESDLNQIKQRDSLATNSENTFISSTSSFVKDMNDNPTPVINTADAFSGMGLVRDLNAP